MVRTIPHRELRNNSSKILEEVRRGEVIHITNHGAVVATLMPPAAAPPPLARRSARTTIPWADFEVHPAPPGGSPIDQEYWDEVRADRLRSI